MKGAGGGRLGPVGKGRETFLITSRRYQLYLSSPQLVAISCQIFPACHWTALALTIHPPPLLSRPSSYLPNYFRLSRFRDNCDMILASACSSNECLACTYGIAAVYLEKSVSGSREFVPS